MSLLRRFWRSLMTIGAYEHESDAAAGKRRIIIGYMFFGQTRWLFATESFGQGLTVVGWTDVAAAVTSLISLFILQVKPRWFNPIMQLLLFTQIAEVLVQTIALGGIIPSGGLMLFGMLSVIGALIVFSARGAFLWFLAYLASLRNGLLRATAGSISAAIR